MKEVLERLLKEFQCLGFTSPPNRTKPLRPWELEEQMGQFELKTHPDSGLHTLHYTFLTEPIVHGLYVHMSPDKISFEPLRYIIDARLRCTRFFGLRT